MEISQYPTKAQEHLWGMRSCKCPPGDVAELVTLVPFSAFQASSQFFMVPGENASCSSTMSLSQHTADTPLCTHHDTEMLVYI